MEDSLDYDKFKAAVQRSYELLPEVYRQKFRGHRKSAAETYFAYAREKRNLFDRWRIASDVTEFTALRELILLEEFEKKSA